MEASVIRIAASTPVEAAGKAIAKRIENGEKVELSAIGAASVNQLVKSTIEANKVLAGKGIFTRCVFAYRNTEVNGLEYSSVVCKLFVVD